MSSWLIEPILELFKELKKILDAAAAAARYFFAYPRKKVACERKHNQTRWQESGLQKENFDKILREIHPAASELKKFERQKLQNRKE